MDVGYEAKKLKKGGQKPMVTDWINSICAIAGTLVALIGLVYLIVNQ